MKLLLDTCSFLWVVQDPTRLSQAAREAFQDPGNEVWLSSVSAWEIAVKSSLGKLRLPESPRTYVPRLRKQHGVETLALDEVSTLQLEVLPALHRDPFDRMLVCQAIVHGLVLLTPDEDITRYPARCLW